MLFRMTWAVIVQVVLAADLLYDDAMTDSLCQFLCVYLQAASAQRECSHSTGTSGAVALHECEGAHAPAAQSADAGGGLLCPSAVLRRCHERPTVILAAEKRYIFTIDDAHVRAPAFEHFLSHVRLAGTESGAGLDAQPCEGATQADGERAAGLELTGRFLRVGDVEGALEGTLRSRDVVLMEIWLEAGPSTHSLCRRAV